MRRLLLDLIDSHVLDGFLVGFQEHSDVARLSTC